jgi:hypothetical protein
MSDLRAMGAALGAATAVTGFTDGEEKEMGLTKVVPFLVEDEMLKLAGALAD